MPYGTYGLGEIRASLIPLAEQFSFLYFKARALLSIERIPFFLLPKRVGANDEWDLGTTRGTVASGQQANYNLNQAYNTSFLDRELWRGQ